MQVHIYNEWTWDKCLKTFSNKLPTNDLQQELLPEWLQHMCLEKTYSSKLICLRKNNEKRKRKSCNKYETANYSLSSAGKTNFYGSRSSRSRSPGMKPATFLMRGSGMLQWDASRVVFCKQERKISGLRHFHVTKDNYGKKVHFYKNVLDNLLSNGRTCCRR